jgi:alkyl hydroperoxide reductase subunit F
MPEYDLIIIGGGPAGAAAAVYASRKRLKTVLITNEWGGQSTESLGIQNWIGTISLTGVELAKSIENHVRAYADDILTIKDRTLVTDLKKLDNHFVLETNKNESISARAILVASGSKRRALTVPGAAEFENKGLTYCASCDGPLFAGQDVAVVGGGNAAMETAAQLLAYAKTVTMIHRNDHFKADPVTVEKVTADPKLKVLLNTEIEKVQGEKFVNGLMVKNQQTGETSTVAVSGLFVEIGMIPNTDFVKNILSLDEHGRVPIDPWTQKTEVPGIWAAGDCTNIKYHQNNISAGDAVKALEDIYLSLKTT